MKNIAFLLLFLFSLLGATLQTSAQEIKLAPPEQRETQTRQGAGNPAETQHQPTALELLDAPSTPSTPSKPPEPPEPLVQIIHEGQTTSDGETLPPIIEERLPPSPEPVTPPPVTSKPAPEPSSTKAADRPDEAAPSSSLQP